MAAMRQSYRSILDVTGGEIPGAGLTYSVGEVHVDGCVSVDGDDECHLA